MRMQSFLQPDAWLSVHLGMPCIRLARAPLSRDEQAAFRDWVSTPCFGYAKMPVDRVSDARAFEQLGFHVVDVNLTLEKSIASARSNSPAGVRSARPEDRTAVTAIARRSFRYSRFHLDPRIPSAKADEIKAAWAGNYFEGKRGDALYVAECEGVCAGFLQMVAADDAWVIDLIAVDAPYRGRGMAEVMIRFAEARADRPLIRVGTQAANIPSLRLYEKLGFRMSAASYVFHLHAPEDLP